MRLRINTLIDGESICEVDFSANHLRLNLAFNGGVDAGDDPYTTVGEEAGIESRQLVKKFFTVAMGGDNEVGALHACYKEGISKENIDRLNIEECMMNIDILQENILKGQRVSPITVVMVHH